MSVGELYRSVRLFCVTLFLIALLQLMPMLSRIWVAYKLTKSEQEALLKRRAAPQLEVPAFRDQRLPPSGDQRSGGKIVSEIAFKRTLKGQHLFQIVQLLMKYGKMKHSDAREKLAGAIHGLNRQFVENWKEDALDLVIRLFGEAK